MQLSIIIVSWNVKELLCRLLDSIFHFTDEIDYEVILVDNNSKDGTTEEVIKHYQDWIKQRKLIIIENKFNAGFAQANNQGLKIAQGEYVVFMNPDMELIENSFKKLYDFYQKTPQIGLLTCRLLYGDRSIQPNIKGFPSLCSQIIILLKLHHLFYWLPCLRQYFKKNFNYSEYGYVDQIMGAFIMTKKEILNQTNGWDEDYWLWWEDVELCKKVSDLGLDIVYNPITEIIHYEGKSFEQIHGVNKQKKFNRGMLIYFKKHASKFAYKFLILLQPVSLFLAFLSGLLKIKGRGQSKFST